MNWKRIAMSVAIGIAVLVVILVVFGEKKLDSADLESKLTTQAAENARIDEADVSVSCPDDVKVEKGTEFDCSATLAGQDVTIVVELTDDDGAYIARLGEPGGSQGTP